jgi:hypothetical protein
MLPIITNKQEGTVLLMALMVMSGLVLAGFTLGSIVINELRQSRQLDQAIVAYYAAESGAEKLIFSWRDTHNDTLFSNPVCNEANTIGWTCSMSTAQPITQLNFSLKQMEVEQIPLYLPNSLNTPSKAESMKIYWQDANITNTDEPWLEITLLGWDASDSSVNWEDQFDGKEIVKRVFTCSNAAPDVPDCDVVIINDFNSTDSYIVRIRPLFDSVNNVKTIFYTQPDAPDGDELVLSPFIKRADFTGTFAGIKQGIRVQFPVVSPLASMFDFVLFTEESLLKAVF